MELYGWHYGCGVARVSWFWHILSIALVAPTYPMNRHLADRLLRMLKHERGDVVIDWQPRIIYNLANSGLAFDDIYFHDASEIVPTKNVHLAFSSHQSDKFRTFVNLRIKMLTDSGKLQEIVERYYKPVVPPPNWSTIILN